MSHEQGQMQSLQDFEARMLRLLDEFELRIQKRFDSFEDRFCGQIDNISDRVQQVTDGSHLRSPNSPSGLVNMMRTWQENSSPWTC